MTVVTSGLVKAFTKSPGERQHVQLTGAYLKNHLEHSKALEYMDRPNKQN